MTVGSVGSVGSVGVVLVGFGWWGRALLDAARGTGLDVVGVVDPAPAAASDAAARGLHVWSTLAEALADPRVGAVVLCSPPTAHHAQLVESLTAGRHVFCEKPFCLTAAEVRDVVALATDGELALGVGHERRFEPPVRALIGAVANGDLGVVLSVEGNFSQDKFLGLDRGNWRFDPQVSPVGPLSATGVHLLDLSVALLGEPTEVWSLASTRGSDFANHDTVATMVRFASGAAATVTACLATPFVGRLAVLGSLGWTEVVDLTHPEQPEGWVVTTHRRGGDRVVTHVPPTSGAAANLAAFADAVLGRAPYPVPTEDLVRTVAVHDAVERSVRERCTVPVDLALEVPA